MTKKKTEEVREKALFSQRFMAIIIDMVIVAAIVSIVAMPFHMDNDNTKKLNDELVTIVDDYTKGDIDIQTYFSRAMDINKDLAKSRGLSMIISLVINIGYFMILPFYYHGQTFGKKVLKIRVGNNDSNGNLNMNNLVIRSLIINSVLTNMFTLALALLAGNEVYFFGSLIIESIQMLVVFASMIAIAIRKDGRGLHDLAANTAVYKVQPNKEVTA